MMKRFFKSAELAFALLNLAILAAVIAYVNISTPVSSYDKWQQVEIPEGSSYIQSLNILQKEGIIKNKGILLFLGRLTAIDRRLRAGYYNFNTSMSPLDIFRKLREGEIIEHTITIPEGSDLNDIKAAFANTGLFNDESWKLVYDSVFINSIGIKAPSLEGYLFPDTYNFSKSAKPKDILKIMHDRLKEKYDDKLRSRAAEAGMSENEVLTLASIIEREARLDSERAVISAVYHNRLKKEMKLQADPTVNYGTERAGCVTKIVDLKNVTPYNTYVIKGLPPGPIASPGIKSIKAALFPADVDYLFFVSKNDGTHYFSKTGEEHVEAVALYRKAAVKTIDEETGKEAEN
ncbi:MAG: endolytic transglycosylase MltG [Nitrospirae bacterium]|nr:endolytic transglycosylase MltG [Nitrospirota bacterium]